MSLTPLLGRQRQVDLQIQGQPGLYSEFQNFQGYTEETLSKKNKTKQNKQKQNKKQKRRKKIKRRNKSSYWESRGLRKL